MTRISGQVLQLPAATTRPRLLCAHRLVRPRGASSGRAVTSPLCCHVTSARAEPLPAVALRPACRIAPSCRRTSPLPMRRRATPAIVIDALSLPVARNVHPIARAGPPDSILTHWPSFRVLSSGSRPADARAFLDARAAWTMRCCGPFAARSRPRTRRRPPTDARTRPPPPPLLSRTRGFLGM